MTKLTHRTDRMSWDEYFMAFAILSSKRSPDPNTQVGACLVDLENRIVSMGYNGFPKGCDNKDFPWEREGDFLDTKYAFVVHAERNAILNAHTKSLEHCKLYVTLFPCNECAKEIIVSGIDEVIYFSDKYHNKDFCVAARQLFDSAGIKYRQFKSMRTGVKIDFNVYEL